MVGEGKLREIIHAQMRLAKRKYLVGHQMPPYNLDLHAHHESAQLRLF